MGAFINDVTVFRGGGPAKVTKSDVFFKEKKSYRAAGARKKKKVQNYSIRTGSSQGEP